MSGDSAYSGEIFEISSRKMGEICFRGPNPSHQLVRVMYDAYPGSRLVDRILDERLEDPDVFAAAYRAQTRREWPFGCLIGSQIASLASEWAPSRPNSNLIICALRNHCWITF
jgi:hypothetical protein